MHAHKPRTPSPIKSCIRKIQQLCHHNQQPKQQEPSMNYLQHHLHAPQRVPLHPTFASRYQLRDVLGEGGFGVVMTARRTTDNQEVAVKFISKSKLSLGQCVQDPELGIVPIEVYLLRRVKHSSIIKFLDFYDDERFYILVTELHGAEWNGRKQPKNTEDAEDSGYESESSVASSSSSDDESSSSTRRQKSMDLFECIETHQGFSEEIARHVFRQIVSAIMYLHANGIVHRDLKDENVVVDNHYRVKLIDFGAAAAFSRKPSQDQKAWFDRFHGTVQYAPPEIVQHQRYRGPEAEMWTLGVLLFTMVANENPFGDLREIVQVCPMERLPEHISSECRDLIASLLMKDPARRPSAEEVLKHSWMRI